MVGVSRKSLVVTMIPFMIMIAILVLCAMWTVSVSFTNFALIGKAAKEPVFVGMKNYIKLIRTYSFFDSLKVTIIYTLFSALVGQSLLGLIFAILLRQPGIRFKKFFEGLLVISWVIPDIVISFMWGAFASKSGFLNVIISPLGFEPFNWITTNPLLTVIIANIWKGTAWSYMLLSAALDTVPPHLKEAANIDGASKFQTLTRVTIPYIYQSILVNLLLITIWTFGQFALIYGITGGGPGSATKVISILLYKEAFESFQFGYGTAISLLMTIIIGAFACIYFYYMRKVENDI